MVTVEFAVICRDPTSWPDYPIGCSQRSHPIKTRLNGAIGKYQSYRQFWPDAGGRRSVAAEGRANKRNVCPAV